MAYSLVWLLFVTISGFSRFSDIGMYMICRQMKQSKFYCDALEQYKCEIQEFRLKLQKQRYQNCYGLDLQMQLYNVTILWICNAFVCRVKLENQLLDLMEQHKILESMFVCHLINTQFFPVLVFFNDNNNNHFYLDFKKSSRWNKACWEYKHSAIVSR